MQQHGATAHLQCSFCSARSNHLTPSGGPQFNAISILSCLARHFLNHQIHDYLGKLQITVHIKPNTNKRINKLTI